MHCEMAASVQQKGIAFSIIFFFTFVIFIIIVYFGNPFRKKNLISLTASGSNNVFKKLIVFCKFKVTRACQ